MIPPAKTRAAIEGAHRDENVFCVTGILNPILLESRL